MTKLLIRLSIGSFVSTALGVLSILLLSGAHASAGDESAKSKDLTALLSKRDFSFGFYKNGWRDRRGESSADLLGLETGYFGLVLDAGDIGHPRFGLFHDDKDYALALADGLKRIENLPAAELRIEVRKDGKVYRAKNSSTSRRSHFEGMEEVRMWESARFVQHYDLLFVDFINEEGQALDAIASLDLLTWPDSLTFRTTLTPYPIFKDGATRGVEGAGWCVKNNPHSLPTSGLPDPSGFSVECWFKLSEKSIHPNGWALILGKALSINENGFFGIGLSGDRVGALLNIGGGKENRFWPMSKAALTKNIWHHLAMTYDGAELVLYLDGKPEAREAINRERVGVKADLVLGAGAEKKNIEGERLYDQVRLWERPLSPQEIAAHASNPAVMASREGLFFEENFDSHVCESSPATWSNAEVSVKFEGAGREWSSSKVFEGDWKEGESKSVVLNCDLNEKRARVRDVSLRVLNKDLPVTFDPGVNAFVLRADQRIKRDWDRFAPESNQLRDYDEFLVEVENRGAEASSLPFLLYFKNPHHIAGCVPTLCHPDGTPTGIPVQLSKNWHLGCYLCAYMYLPAPLGKATFLVRISYGFYGTVPQASHSQLSLIGWGGNGRWDQIAIGGWGETLCLDMDHSETEGIITDNRGMLLRNGKDGPLWGWCESGWGGDWLNVKNEAGQKLFLRGLKTAYTAHGPCLSEIEYRGHFGEANEVEMKAVVHSPRTDDYVRTFFEKSYTFKTALPAKDAWLFKMGRSHRLVTPRVAFGNREGLITELSAPAGAKAGDILVDHLELEGEGPWWIAYPDAQPQLPPGRENFGVGSRALIIRSFKGVFGGREFRKPSISLQVHQVQADGKMDIDALVVPPKEVAGFKPGDCVEMDIEWLCVPRVADDYYGPNEALRDHLIEAPLSWKTIYREAVGNDLKIAVTGGTLLRKYPILVRAEKSDSRKPQSSSEILLDIDQGGVGFVPVRFEGLKSIDGYKLYEMTGRKMVPLDQSVHGNDFWQTDYNAGSRTYSLSYNLPLDGKTNSSWILKKEP